MLNASMKNGIRQTSLNFCNASPQCFSCFVNTSCLIWSITSVSHMQAPYAGEVSYFQPSVIVNIFCLTCFLINSDPAMVLFLHAHGKSCLFREQVGWCLEPAQSYACLLRPIAQAGAFPKARDIKGQFKGSFKIIITAEHQYTRRDSPDRSSPSSWLSQRPTRRQAVQSYRPRIVGAMGLRRCCALSTI